MLRTGQYAQAGSRPVGGEKNKVGIVRTYGGPGEGWIGTRCKNRGRSDTFTIRLAFIRTLGQAFRDAHWRTFGETFGRTRKQGCHSGRKLVFALEGTFISAFAFVVRTTTGALRRGNCISHSGYFGRCCLCQAFDVWSQN